MSCSYTDIVMIQYDVKGEDYFFKHPVLKRFQYDIFLDWIYGCKILPAYLNYLNDHYVSKKIQFTIQTRELEVLEFIDLKLSIYSNNKISTDFYAYLTNSFIYVLPSTSYNKKIINKLPKGIALRLRGICDSDKKSVAPQSTKFIY